MVSRKNSAQFPGDTYYDSLVRGQFVKGLYDSSRKLK